MSGCAELLEDAPPVDALRMRIADVRKPDVGVKSATIPVLFEVQNTHEADDIPSPTIDYNGYVNDEEVVSSREVIPTLGPGDSTTEEFDLLAEYADLGVGIADAISEEEFTVTVAGTVTSEGAEAPFEETYRP